MTGAAEIRAMIAGRRRRELVFGPGLFHDPAWDILLDLAASQIEGRRVSVSDLCLAAAVPYTTAFRHVAALTAAGLLIRTQDDTDDRRVWITLNVEAAEKMDRVLCGPVDPLATPEIRRLVAELTAHLELANHPLRLVPAGAVAA